MTIIAGTLVHSMLYWHCLWLHASWPRECIRWLNWLSILPLSLHRLKTSRPNALTNWTSSLDVSSFTTDNHSRRSGRQPNGLTNITRRTFNFSPSGACSLPRLVAVDRLKVQQSSSTGDGCHRCQHCPQLLRSDPLPSPNRTQS